MTAHAARSIPFPVLAPAFPAPLAGLVSQAFDLLRAHCRQALGLIVAMARPAETEAPPLSRETLQRFQALIVPHLDSAYNFARFLCRDPDAAGDIVQDAFLRAYRSFDGYRGGEPRAWMFAIIRNCHRAWQNDGRSRARREVSMTTDKQDDAEHPAYRIAAETDTPETATMRQSEASRVRRVIASLPEAMREVLVLRELEDLSYRQISDALDIPVGTVMSRLARARTEFAEAWQALEHGEGGL